MATISPIHLKGSDIRIHLAIIKALRRLIKSKDSLCKWGDVEIACIESGGWFRRNEGPVRRK